MNTKILDQNLKKIVDDILKSFFNIHKEIIEKVFEIPGQSNLHYYIVLKEDTTENRSIFFNFINNYEELGIENKLPIIIQFIPRRVMDKVLYKIIL